MTWTVAGMGAAGSATTLATPVASMTLTLSPTAAAGDNVAVFVVYTDIGVDTFTIKDSANNVYTNVDSAIDTTSGECVASAYFINLPGGITTITASNSAGQTTNGAIIQDLGAIKFSNSVAGTVTLDGNHILDNSTATLTPNSGAANSTNGDVVLTGIMGDGTNEGGTTSLGITGGSSIAINNDHRTTTSYIDGSGTTTASGVTSTWTVTTSKTYVVAELVFKPPGASFVPPHRRAVSYSIPIFLRR